MKDIFRIVFISSLLMPCSGFVKAETDWTAQQRELARRQTGDIGENVKYTFETVRKNSRSDLQSPEVETALLKLKELGAEVIPFIEPYLNDANLQVRRETINLAFQIGGEKSLNLIAAGLRNSQPEIRRMADDNLYLYSYYFRYGKTLPPKNGFPFNEKLPYQSFSPEKIAANQLIGNNLRANVSSGNADISTIFLLANFPGNETDKVLTEFFRQKTAGRGKKTLLKTDQITLAAAVVKANANSRQAVLYLSQIVGSRHYFEPTKFLLTNIVEINSPETLSLLIKTLDDQTLLEKQVSSAELVKNLPKGSFVDRKPPRRICDLAVNSFAGKFSLKISFALHSTIYTEKQISEVRELLKEQIKSAAAD